MFFFFYILLFKVKFQVKHEHLVWPTRGALHLPKDLLTSISEMNYFPELAVVCAGTVGLEVAVIPVLPAVLPPFA